MSDKNNKKKNGQRCRKNSRQKYLEDEIAIINKGKQKKVFKNA